MANKEIKVGEVGIIDGRKVIVIESFCGFCGADFDGTADCWFTNVCGGEEGMFCAESDREDGKSVFYEKADE